MKQSGYPIAIQLSKSRVPPLAGPNCFRAPCLAGGDERNRTADPLLAKQVLSRLSYIPTIGLPICDCGLPIEKSKIVNLCGCLVGLPGIEPGTSRLSSVRSDQLS